MSQNYFCFNRLVHAGALVFSASLLVLTYNTLESESRLSCEESLQTGNVVVSFQCNQGSKELVVEKQYQGIVKPVLEIKNKENPVNKITVTIEKNVEKIPIESMVNEVQFKVDE